MVDLSEYRNSFAEQQRAKDLLRLAPTEGMMALDIGARDGYFARLLAERFDKVVALDLTKPVIPHPKIFCVEGNAAKLEFPDDSFDFVFCAEVLEHIPKNVLQNVCAELQRVCRGKLLIGVPYKQDIRVGRTTCYACKQKNPPWGHVNSFDTNKLSSLFADCRIEATSFVGTTTEQTNAVSMFLMDLAGNPYGTYTQEEPCIYCGSTLVPPPYRNLAQRLMTRLAFVAQRTTIFLEKPRGNWIHVLFAKRPG